MKFIPFFMVSCLLFCSCSNPEPTQVELHYPDRYVIHKAMSELDIDGLMNEDDWINAEWTSDFIDIEGTSKPLPFYQSRTKMLWDENYIYFYAEMEEEHIWGDITERDAVIFYNNDFEVFIKPDANESHYVEFEVNALGTLWELILLKPYRIGGPVSNNWDLKGTKIGIDIDGTLNNSTDIDKKWTVEMAIPINPIAELKRGSKIEDGTQWRINFSRVQWQHDLENGVYSRKKDDEGKFLPEYNWVWSPQYAIDMHRPEHWGIVQFSDKTPGEEIDFIEEAFEIERQLLFHLHREQLNYRKEHKAFAKDIQILGGPLFEYESVTFEVELQDIPNGYILSITDSEKGSISLDNKEHITISK